MLARAPIAEQAPAHWALLENAYLRLWLQLRLRVSFILGWFGRSNVSSPTKNPEPGNRKSLSRKSFRYGEPARRRGVNYGLYAQITRDGVEVLKVETKSRERIHTVLNR